MQSQPSVYIGAKGARTIRYNKSGIRTIYLLLFCLGDHVVCHVPHAFVNNLRHRRHDPFGLCSIETFALKSLYKVVRVKMKVGRAWRRVEELLAVGTTLCIRRGGAYWLGKSVSLPIIIR